MKHRMWISTFGVLAFSAALGLSGVIINTSQADDPVATKAKNAVEDIKTDLKKTKRKAKKQIRKARGKNHVLEDAKDKVQDVGDDIHNAAKKTKNKLEE